MKGNFFFRCFWTIFLSVLSLGTAFSVEITQAGFAFSGDAASAAQRFPYTWKLFEHAKTNPDIRTFSFEINQRTKELKNPELEFAPLGQLVNLKDSDRALMSVFALTGETVSTEKFGSFSRTFVNLRGNAIIFDYKNQTIVTSWPVSVIYFDASEKNKPTTEQILSIVNDVIRRKDGKGLITQYLRRLSDARLPKEGRRTVQVKHVSVSNEALSQLPEAYRIDNGAAAKAMVKEGFGAILSARLKMPMMPSTVGHMDGVMMLRLENGDDWKLTVPEGDYLFDVSLDKLVKKEFARDNVSTTNIYGAYMNIRFYGDGDYLNSKFRNGEIDVMPASFVSGSDFPYYENALTMLVKKFASSVDRSVKLKIKDPEDASKKITFDADDWLKTSAKEPDIRNQLNRTYEIIRKCR